MESINQSDMEKAVVSKRPKAAIQESNQEDMRRIRFRFVTAEMLRWARKKKCSKGNMKKLLLKYMERFPWEKRLLKCNAEEHKENHGND